MFAGVRLAYLGSPRREAYFTRDVEEMVGQVRLGHDWSASRDTLSGACPSGGPCLTGLGEEVKPKPAGACGTDDLERVSRLRTHSLNVEPCTLN